MPSCASCSPELPSFALFVWALVEALRRSDAEWQTAGQSKVLWVILIAALGILGAVLSYVTPRPQLARVRAAGVGRGASFS